MSSEAPIQTQEATSKRKDRKAAAAAAANASATTSSTAATEEKAFVNTVPPGQKKTFDAEMDTVFNPAKVEASWDAFWEAQDLFKPDEEAKEKFVIMIPPPNVTGTLHIGHALTLAIEDAVVRWNRMNGKGTLWVPGVDHAGIATQVVVEKQLARTQGVSRHDLGREKFIEAVWDWKEKNGVKIFDQMRKLGASVDWSRCRFTMDPVCAAAVQEAFIRMHSAGKIYRANRLVSWSCALRSAISSIEVEHLDVEGSTKIKVPGYDKPVEVGVLHSFAYQVKDSNEQIIVSTTRIETMLGDVAVAVHPEDPRYQHLIGKELVHPFIDNRKVVVVADKDLVDMKFGTGAVKITPAHDPNDFACGQRHNLPRINILDDRGFINTNGGKYAGMHRYEVRDKIVDDLKALDLYHGKADNKMAIGLCSRSKDIIEPIVRPQWWVDCKEMADRSVQAVKNKDLTILPNQHEIIWYRWLESIQDWCISRQLWWGHRIPAFYAKRKGEAFPSDEEDNGRWIIAPTLEAAQEEAKKRFPEEYDSLELEQDHDVLDTWFSSGLFPFSVMHWPNTDHPDFLKYFPGHLLETGQDILFFWVARMVMMSLELTDKLPFNTVYLHAMVRDRLGRKMSKSLGNVIDPLDVITGISLSALQKKLEGGNLDPKEVVLAQSNLAKEFPKGIENCGADGLRFGLLAYLTQGSDINLDINRIVAARAFCNKMWNAMRFALANFPADFAQIAPMSLQELDVLIAKAGGLTPPQRWILSRLHNAIVACDDAFTKYEFGNATYAMQAFITDELCARYLELIKSIVKPDPTSNTPANPDSATSHLAVLFICLDYGLRLLHPIIPFVTEELWHRLPGHARRTAQQVANKPGDKRVASGSIMIAPYPRPSWTQHLSSLEAEQEMATMDTIIEALRSAKASVQLTRAQRPQTYIVCTSDKLVNLVKRDSISIATLAAVSDVTPLLKSEIEEGKTPLPTGALARVVNADLTAYMVIEGLVDIAALVVRTERKLTEIVKTNDNLLAVVSVPTYATAVKPEIRAQNEAKLQSNASEIAALKQAIASYMPIVDRKAYLSAKTDDMKRDMDKILKYERAAQDTLAKGETKKARETYESIIKQKNELQGQIDQLVQELSNLTI